MLLSVENVPKDIIAIIDKYLHRYKWRIVNDEYNMLVIYYWSKEKNYFYSNNMMMNYRKIEDSSTRYSVIFNMNTSEVTNDLPINYIHAKLYK